MPYTPIDPQRNNDLMVNPETQEKITAAYISIENGLISVALGGIGEK